MYSALNSVVGLSVIHDSLILKPRSRLPHALATKVPVSSQATGRPSVAPAVRLLTCCLNALRRMAGKCLPASPERVQGFRRAMRLSRSSGLTGVGHSSFRKMWTTEWPHILVGLGRAHSVSITDEISYHNRPPSKVRSSLMPRALWVQKVIESRDHPKAVAAWANSSHTWSAAMRSSPVR